MTSAPTIAFNIGFHGGLTRNLGLVAVAVGALGLLLMLWPVRLGRRRHIHPGPHVLPVAPWLYTLVVACLIGLVGLATTLIVFVARAPDAKLGREADDRFKLLLNLLKGLALGGVAVALVSILAAIILQPSRVRRAVRRLGQRAISMGRRERGGVLARPGVLIGSFVLWLSASSLQIEDFKGDVPDVDAAAVSNALSGFLSDIGSPTPIGGADRIDPRLAVAPYQATTVAQDIEKALSDAPYGKAAAALLSLAERLLPREQLYVSGYVLLSAQRGPGVTMTLAKANGDVVDSETIWSGDLEPALLAGDAATRATTSSTLVLAIAGAVWLTFALVRRSGQRVLKDSLGTDSWQSFALVRVGLQGAMHRPRRLTRAIYARGVEADPENRTAVFNLGLTETRGLDDGDIELAMIGVRRLEGLYELITAPASHPRLPLFPRTAALLVGAPARMQADPLALSVVFNLAVTALNDEHSRRRDRGAPRLTPPAAERPAGGRTQQRERLRIQLVAVERQLARRPAGERGLSSGDRVVGQLEKPLLAVWAAMAQQSGLPSFHQSPGSVCRALWPVEMDAADELERQRHAHGVLAERLHQRTLCHRDLVVHYLERLGVDARTRYNLACYWAAGDDPVKALRELRLSLEPGTVGQGARWDPAFIELRRTHGPQFQRALTSGQLYPSAGG